jgi:anti-anti-sigma regulatory factor
LHQLSGGGHERCGGTPVNAVRQAEGPRYGFVRCAGSGHAWVRGCHAGGGGKAAVGADTQITDLTVNDHACLTFGDREELFDLTAAFVRDGLSGGLKVVWLSEAGPAQAAAELERRGIAVKPAIAAGQMAAAGSEGKLLRGQAFSAGRALGWLDGQMAAGRQQGFPGLRVAVDMGWALRPMPGVEQLPEFEEGIAAALAGTAVSVLCQYDRERFDPVTLATVAAFHTRSVAAATYHADAVLRICRQYAPPGIRLAGEIDHRSEEPLALALAEAIRLEGDITVNMTQLVFIDASCARMILDAARGVAGSRAVVLACHPGIAARFVLLGATAIPGVSVVSVDDR